MELINVITIAVAVLFGPVAAVQVDRFLSRRRENRKKKNEIFKTLMATRGTTLSYHHVEALNRIDLEFAGNKKFENVIIAWKEYFDQLNQPFNDEQFPVWNSRKTELFTELLFQMGKSLGYSFDKVLIKRNAYSPVGHANQEHETQLIRKYILEVLEGRRNMPFELIQNYDEDTIQRQNELQRLMTEYYRKELE